MKARLFVGEVPIDELTPEDREKFRNNVVAIYEKIILDNIERMQEEGRSKEEIMKYLGLN